MILHFTSGKRVNIMIGKKLKARREELGMTQEELAKKLGYKSKSTINKIEMDINDVSQSKLVRIADALDVPPTYFMEYTDHDMAESPIDKYAEAFSRLSALNQANVMKYMEFLAKEEQNG